MCECEPDQWCDVCTQYYMHQQELEYEEYLKQLKDVRKENQNQMVSYARTGYTQMEKTRLYKRSNNIQINIDLMINLQYYHGQSN